MSRKFSSSFNSEVIEIDDQQYVIKEMTCTQRDKFVADQVRRTKIKHVAQAPGAEGAAAQVVETSETDIAGAQEFLLTLCLYKDDALVPAETIRTWPGRLVADIYEVAVGVNGLRKKAEDRKAEAKNA